MKIFIVISILLLLLTSCVSESEYQKIIDEKNLLATENQYLKDELEEIKFGAPNLLSDGIKFYEAKDFDQAKQKFQILVEKHPNMNQSIEAKKYLENIDEEQMWYSALNSDDIIFTETYISNYPKGKYIINAVSKNNELKDLNMQKAYSEALASNTYYAWDNFLANYPDYPNKDIIYEKIIRLEVDAIFSDSKTGKMPSFQSLSSSYSSSSSVEIKNNTGCMLTIRYSGPEAKELIIFKGDTRTVDLVSGSYKIAASACGSNYAGIENLQGNYSSTFYIKSSNY